MPNRRRSASRSASPSQSRSRTRLDSGEQRDEDTDEEHNEDLNENAQSIRNQGDNEDNRNNMRIKATARMLEMVTLVMVQAFNQLILSCCQ